MSILKKRKKKSRKKRDNGWHLVFSGEQPIWWLFSTQIPEICIISAIKSSTIVVSILKFFFQYPLQSKFIKSGLMPLMFFEALSLILIRRVVFVTMTKQKQAQVKKKSMFLFIQTNEMLEWVRMAKVLIAL